MSILCIVDSREAVSFAREEMPGATLVTDNPLLAADPATGSGVENIDALVSQSQANSLGEAAIDGAADLDRQLDEPANAERLGLHPGYVRVGQNVSRLLASLFHRGAVLARALDAHAPDEVAICCLETPRWEANNPLILPYFASPARALSEDGFFAGRRVSFQAVAAPLPAVVNDTAIQDYGRRIAMMPLPLLAYELWQRLRGGRGRGRGALVIGQENDAIREALPWFAAGGLRYVRRGKLVPRQPIFPPGFDERVEIDSHISACVDAAIAERLAATSCFDASQTSAIMALVARHVSAGLHHLSAQVPAIERRVEEWFGADGGVLVTNGLYGPAGAQAYGICRSRGVRIVEFEHGVTAGLSALTDRKLLLSGGTSADLLLVCSDRAASAHAAGTGAKHGKILAVGLPDQTRRLLRVSLQRRLARKRLGLDRHKAVIMHVSTLPYLGNLRPGLFAPTETATFALDQKLITEVYPQLPHRVVFKQYPTQRFPYEPGYDRLFSAAANISYTKDEDFRYIRAAADIIVTMTPTSTFGWCVGAGVPIVWLDSRYMNPLSDEALRDAFRESFLFVDLDEDGWPDQLARILNRGIGAIQADWSKRATARQRLYRNAITGRPGSFGRHAASVVAAFVKDQSTQPTFAERTRGATT